jgi:xanthine dehydrogenase small subunit
MAAVPSRAPLTEAALIGAPVPQSASSAVVQADLPTQVGAAMQALRSEFKPLDDLRASAAYRSEVAANLVLRSWLGLRAVHDVPPALSLSELLPVLVEASA